MLDDAQAVLSGVRTGRPKNAISVIFGSHGRAAHFWIPLNERSVTSPSVLVESADQKKVSFWPHPHASTEHTRSGKAMYRLHRWCVPVSCAALICGMAASATWTGMPPQHSRHEHDQITAPRLSVLLSVGTPTHYASRISCAPPSYTSSAHTTARGSAVSVALLWF